MPDASSAGAPGTLERHVQDRDAPVTAAVRSRAYRLYSLLLASPHEIDVDRQLRQEVIAGELYPYEIDLGGLCDTYLNADISVKRREYSGLFEVGDEGAAIAIREQQQYSDVAGILENLVRFYEFFDYPLREQYAWAPDHMSVILEFCHLLCYRESVASVDRLSFQLAQFDFVSRHLVAWPPVLAARIEEVQPGSLYSAIGRSVSLFLARDHAWQASTVSDR